MSSKAIYFVPAKPLATLCKTLEGKLHESYTRVTYAGDSLGILNAEKTLSQNGEHLALRALLRACKIPHIREHHPENVSNHEFSSRGRRRELVVERYKMNYDKGNVEKVTTMTDKGINAEVLSTVNHPLSAWSAFALKLLSNNQLDTEPLIALARNPEVKQNTLNGQLQILIEAADINDANLIKRFIEVAKSVTSNPGNIRNETCGTRQCGGWGSYILMHYARHDEQLSISDFEQIISLLWEGDAMYSFHEQVIKDLESLDNVWHHRITGAMSRTGIVPDDEKHLASLENAINVHGEAANGRVLERIKWKRLMYRSESQIDSYIDSEPPTARIGLSL